MSADPAGIDVVAVTAWITAHIEGATPPLRFDLIAGGRSNLTYVVTDATGNELILRRPPLGHVLATAHDMAREHRLMSALEPTAVPVPRMVALCSDETVNGAPFYLMSRVGGVVLHDQSSAAAIPPATRHQASVDLVDVLAALHCVDPDAVGLGDLARRDGYIERQIRRWSAQWQQSKTRDLPVVDGVAARLAATIPQQQAVVIAHGDFRFGNCLVDPTSGRVQAVLDWELCTLGDPLADLGYLGVYWVDPGAPPRRNDPTGLDGFMTYAEVVALYAARTGFDVSLIDYYRAFSAWRLAVISEGVYARYLAGAMGDRVDAATLADYRRGVDDLAEMAAGLLA